jgi:glycosyltransferase involved in cell wall biosynthesis
VSGRGHKVIFDLVAAQSPSYRGRGIARYSTDFVRAMVAHHPDLVASVVLHPELPVPKDLGDLSEWVTMAPAWEDGGVLHLSSVFEPEVPVRTFWPREAAAHGLLTAVTLYDLIPELFPGWYLEDPGLRRRWRCCREVVRVADRVFTLSHCARRDAIDVLGVPGSRVTVVGSAPSPAFQRAESRQDAFKVASAGVDGLEEGFVVYNGAFNPRKNVDGLVKAYASLSRELIDAHQLVVVGAAPPLTRNHYLVMAKELGVDGRLLIPGFVAEDVLVSLYQSTALSVYPSLYEGFGLPLVESMACGAPTLAGDNSSLVEILPREACFQAEDPGAIAAAIERGLTDETFRERLVAVAAREQPSWKDVADRAAEVFGQMLQRASSRPPRWRRRPQLALVGLPSDLERALSEVADSDKFAPPESGPGSAGPGTVLAWRLLERLDAWRAGYDAVVLWAKVLGPKSLGAVEKLVSEGQAQVIALVDAPPSPGKQDKHSHKAAQRLANTVSTLKQDGVVVLDAGLTPADTARLVLQALNSGRHRA